LTFLDIPADHPIVSIVKPVQCQHRDHFNSFFNEICRDRPKELQAEGVVLRDPTAWYFKTDSFFKKKVEVSCMPLILLGVRRNYSNTTGYAVQMVRIVDCILTLLLGLMEVFRHFGSQG
jgi:hypothetical protein